MKKLWEKSMLKLIIKFFRALLSRSMQNRLEGKQCQTCGRTSPKWCNYFDWYGDGQDCNWEQMVKGPIWIERPKPRNLFSGF